MIALIQRVTESRVEVAGEVVGAIGPGLLALVAVQPDDSETQAQRLAERLLTYRVFPDDQARMNLSLREHGGGLLLVPQFTLAADTRKGNRPSFTRAASPALGRQLFDVLYQRLADMHTPLAQGRFGADMKVHLINDGPVTFWLQS